MRASPSRHEVSLGHSFQANRRGNRVDTKVFRRVTNFLAKNALKLPEMFTLRPEKITYMNFCFRN